MLAEVGGQGTHGLGILVAFDSVVVDEGTNFATLFLSLNAL